MCIYVNKSKNSKQQNLNADIFTLFYKSLTSIHNLHEKRQMPHNFICKTYNMTYIASYSFQGYIFFLLIFKKMKTYAYVSFVRKP